MEAAVPVSKRVDALGQGEEDNGAAPSDLEMMDTTVSAPERLTVL